MVKTVRGLQDFQTIVNDELSLNKGSMTLVKLDTPKNLTERVLRSKKITDEYNKGAHDARFDTDILMKVIRQFIKSFEKDTEDFMNCKMLRSQDFIYLVESKVEENEETASNGWWSMAGV